MQWAARPWLFKVKIFFNFGRRRAFLFLLVCALFSFSRESCKGETRDDSEADEQERGEGSTPDELDAGEGEGLILSLPLPLEESGMFP